MIRDSDDFWRQDYKIVCIYVYHSYLYTHGIGHKIVGSNY